MGGWVGGARGGARTRSHAAAPPCSTSPPHRLVDGCQREHAVLPVPPMLPGLQCVAGRRLGRVGWWDAQTRTPPPPPPPPHTHLCGVAPVLAVGPPQRVGKIRRANVIANEVLRATAAAAGRRSGRGGWGTRARGGWQWEGARTRWPPRAHLSSNVHHNGIAHRQQSSVQGVIVSAQVLRQGAGREKEGGGGGAGWALGRWLRPGRPAPAVRKPIARSSPGPCTPCTTPALTSRGRRCRLGR